MRIRFLIFISVFPQGARRRNDEAEEEWSANDGDVESDAGRLFRALKHQKVRRALKRIIQSAIREQTAEQKGRA